MVFSSTFVEAFAGVLVGDREGLIYPPFPPPSPPSLILCFVLLLRSCVRRGSVGWWVVETKNTCGFCFRRVRAEREFLQWVVLTGRLKDRHGSGAPKALFSVLLCFSA